MQYGTGSSSSTATSEDTDMPPKGPACYICRKHKFDSEQDAEDHFCSGCNQHICDDCDKNISLMGEHDAMEHTEEGEY